MEWMTPILGSIAAAVSIPLLLLLYFLKLKRTEQLVSSTLLWKRAIQDLQVNAPFQRLRRNILLLLQMLTLLAILLALAGPVISLFTGKGQRYVVLIDRSASMNATDVQPSRLAAAKAGARDFIESINTRAFFQLQESGDKVMVVAFDEHSKVMCNFTSDKRQLLAAIDAIEPGDGRSKLGEALTVANAFAQSLGDEANNRSPLTPAQVILYSDGRIADLNQIAIAAEDLVFHRVGTSLQNAGIVTLQARRSYENPDEVTVFATAANYGTESVTCDVRLGLNEDVLSVRSITVPARTPGTGDNPDEPGKTAVEFSFLHPGSGVVEVRLLHNDTFDRDDAAWAILTPPRQLSVLLVTEGNPVLESALKACPISKLDRVTGSEFDAMDHGILATEQPYDVIVLDNYVPVDVPKSRYLVFGRPPKGIDVVVPGQLESQVIVDWRSRHAVMKYVNMATLFAAKTYQMILPRDAEILAEFNETAAISLLQRKGSVFLLAGFDVLDTNWPFEPSFILFFYNSLAYLGMQVGAVEINQLATGDPILLEGLDAYKQVTIDGPDVSGQRIEVDPSGTARFANTDKVGVYTITLDEQNVQAFAVNLLDSHESNIEPAQELVLTGEIIQAEAEGSSRASVPLWPWLVLTALFLVCLEWLVYNSKVRI
ncbi:MAG: VWA domain-containing protein [Sedimentisphaerales bacterium]|nr:VWA domain-containing protein [Sedimentisphaerales bacterium]